MSDLAGGAGWRRYLPYSLAAHALLAAGLYWHGPLQDGHSRQAAERQRLQATEQRAGQLTLRRQVESMAAVLRSLDANAAVPPPAAQPQDALAQAQALLRAIEQADQADRARELAGLLAIPLAQALRQVRETDRAAPVSAPPAGVAQTVAQLERRARQLAARRQLQLAQRRDGVPLPGVPGRGAVGAGGAALSEAAPAPAPGGTADVSGAKFRDARHYGVLAPSFDVGSARLGYGRKAGAGAAYADRVYLDAWYLIGPFAGAGAASMARDYPPERVVDLDGVYRGQAGRLLQWQYVSGPAYPRVPPDSSENAVYYAYTEVYMERERDLWLMIGADDDSMLWLNDRLVWQSGNEDKRWYRTPYLNLKDDIAGMNLSEGRRRVHLRQGRNTVLLKLYNSVGLTFYSVLLAADRPPG
ncbi:hypothetical protein H7U20_20490 [Rugamonas sp. CCM 8940]|uniref:hypothetical protein n=1 Tax=Rugamonas sp. CCM 8940 TaxID=2765359 RepID=UPI0018F39FE4|nr:hypothetical protein [Rugamonas sp. CCM 8940]MBJ7312561.1 hypothetical protein [Rugamonas sp. CCM 8940]